MPPPPSSEQLVVALVALVALDVAFISSNRAMFDRAARSIQGHRINFNAGGALLAYACIYALIVIFALPEVLARVRTSTTMVDRLAICARYAGLLGLLTYGVYDFTTKAVLTNYPWRVALIDTAWGSVMFTLVAFVASYAR